MASEQGSREVKKKKKLTATTPSTLEIPEAASEDQPHLLEGGEQLDAHIAQLVPPHVLQQEGILLQVFIRKVEFDLIHQFLDELLIRGLPLLLQVLMLVLAPTRSGATEARRDTELGVELCPLTTIPMLKS